MNTRTALQNICNLFRFNEATERNYPNPFNVPDVLDDALAAGRAALAADETSAREILAEIIACDEDSDFRAGLVDGCDIDGGEQSARLCNALARARAELALEPAQEAA